MSLTLPLFREGGFGNNRKGIRFSDAVCDLARRLWPSKTAANLAGRAGTSVRAAELWLEGRTEPGAEALVQLLRSDAGFELLQNLMEGSGTRWWREFEQGVQIAVLEQQIAWRKESLAKLKGELK